MTHVATGDKPIESQILTIACYLGIGRLLLAGYHDFYNAPLITDTFIDALLFANFVVTLLLSKTMLPLQFRIVIFLVPLIFLLAVNWIITGGLHGDGEYHFMMLYALVVLLLNGRKLVLFMMSLLLVQIILLHIDNSNYNFAALLREGVYEGSLGSIHYLIIVAITMYVIVYLKSKFDRDRELLRSRGRDLKNKLEHYEWQNLELEIQKKELVKVKRLLEKEVIKRKRMLAMRHQKLENYWELSLQEINEPLKITVRSINEMKVKAPNENELVNMLSDSGRELLNRVRSVVREFRKETI